MEIKYLEATDQDTLVALHSEKPLSIADTFRKQIELNENAVNEALISLLNTASVSDLELFTEVNKKIDFQCPHVLSPTMRLIGVTQERSVWILYFDDGGLGLDTWSYRVNDIYLNDKLTLIETLESII